MRELILLIWVFIYVTPFKATCDDRTISRALAEVAIETKSESITLEAYKAGKMAIIDVMGVSIAAYDIPGVKEVSAQMADWGGKNESTIWFYKNKIPAPNAVFANSVLVHALDLDDLHPASSLHITSIVVPVAFAIGEMQHASGREVLDAIILGIEVAGRIGKEYRPRREHGGFLPTSIVGGFGAVAASARLMGLTVEQTMDAFGIFYAHASGNRQALFDRTLTKRIQPAIAAEAGTKATFLALRGITGPKNIFLTNAGFFRIYGGGKGEPPTVEDIMQKKDFYEVEKLAYKKYVACGASHAAIEAAVNLSKKHDLKLDEIAEIEIAGVNSSMVGGSPFPPP